LSKILNLNNGGKIYFPEPLFAFYQGLLTEIGKKKWQTCKDSTRSEATKCLSDSEGNLGQSE